ncbi:branched-chain amino acid ABC transporter permease [Aeromicrobium chenweiae]|uniref:Branched-chain amino acid ABC transporter permease n=1 Tax=Aeromicrobium chenweiae TaxID=2079793 RepID=A0A2S0WL14_9ACTN|nr:branched-chain amino acid ABC transporter permease [Aeromicrobium chenweiae]TGN33079.1 branched-chain amino acid ABC transporter permease [Aeromicrobium chenweiae]
MRLAALLAAALGTSLLLVPATASAETTTPTPTPTTSAGIPDQNPIVQGANITVTLKDLKGGEGEPEPVPGVSLTVLKDSDTGEEQGTQTTDKTGRVSIGIPGNGTYVVKLDPKTLPEGVELSGQGETTKTVQVKLASSNFVQFQIGALTVEKASKVSEIIDGTRSGVIKGLLIALAALGLSLIFGTTGLTNFAHGELITLGAITTYIFNQGIGLPVILAGVCAVIVCAIFGYLQDRGLWRPLRRRGTGLIAMMIVSIGLAVFMRSIFQYGFGGSTRTLSEYVVQGRQSYGPIDLSHKEIAILLVTIVTIAVTCIALMRTRLGKAMRAVSDNPALSASSGMRVDGVISAVWVLGTALTGLAGVLLAVQEQVKFQMGFDLLLLVFAGVTLGGLGTIWGALVGSLIIGLMVELGPVFGVPASIKEVGALVVLILILLVRPQGILGKAERIG